MAIRTCGDCSTWAMKLEGLPRHASTHAAGVVIGDPRPEELVPLYRDRAPTCR
jgi:DNA polymerase III alpha subunit